MRRDGTHIRVQRRHTRPRRRDDDNDADKGYYYCNNNSVTRARVHEAVCTALPLPLDVPWLPPPHLDDGEAFADAAAATWLSARDVPLPALFPLPPHMLLATPARTRMTAMTAVGADDDADAKTTASMHTSRRTLRQQQHRRRSNSSSSATSVHCNDAQHAATAAGATTPSPSSSPSSPVRYSASKHRIAVARARQPAAAAEREQRRTRVHRTLSLSPPPPMRVAAAAAAPAGRRHRAVQHTQAQHTLSPSLQPTAEVVTTSNVARRRTTRAQHSNAVTAHTRTSRVQQQQPQRPSMSSTRTMSVAMSPSSSPDARHTADEKHHAQRTTKADAANATAATDTRHVAAYVHELEQLYERLRRQCDGDVTASEQPQQQQRTASASRPSSSSSMAASLPNVSSIRTTSRATATTTTASAPADVGSRSRSRSSSSHVSAPVAQMAVPPAAHTVRHMHNNNSSASAEALREQVLLLEAQWQRLEQLTAHSTTTATAAKYNDSDSSNSSRRVSIRHTSSRVPSIDAVRSLVQSRHSHAALRHTT